MITDSYGFDSDDTLQICYINDSNPGNSQNPTESSIAIAKWELGLLLVFPYVFVNTFNGYVLVKFKKKIEKTRQERFIPKPQLKFIKYVLLFPSIMFICWIFHFIRILLDISGVKTFDGSVLGEFDLCICNLSALILTILFIRLMIRFQQY